MTDKPIGPAAAAREIDRQYATWMTEVTARAKRLDAIEAIILKHCPQDKAVGELVKVSRRLSEWVRGLAGECLKEDVRKLLKDFETALADHEKVNNE